MGDPIKKPDVDGHKAPGAAHEMSHPEFKRIARQAEAGATTSVLPDEHLVSVTAPGSFEAEQYRILRHTVEEKQKETGLRVVAVSSPGGGDGKTTTAINLAGALAQAVEARVLLVEADLRRPSVAQSLGERPAPRGLVEAVLDPAVSLTDVVKVCPRFNLSVLLAGSPPVAPYEVLKSRRLGDLLAEARQRYDYIVLDTPPIVPCPDYRLIEKWIDGVIVVVGAHKTPRKMVEAAVSLVSPAKLVALVFNGDDSLEARYHYSARTESGAAGKKPMLRGRRGR